MDFLFVVVTGGKGRVEEQKENGRKLE